MSDIDWRRIPVVVTDRFQVAVSPETVRIVFGQAVSDADASFHTAVIMSRKNATALIQLVKRLLDQAAAGTSASGGPVH